MKSWDLGTFTPLTMPCLPNKSGELYKTSIHYRSGFLNPFCFSNVDFIKSTISNSSWVWKGIQKGKEILDRGIRWQVRFGEKINV